MCFLDIKYSLNFKKFAPVSDRKSQIPSSVLLGHFTLPVDKGLCSLSEDKAVMYMQYMYLTIFFGPLYSASIKSYPHITMKQWTLMTSHSINNAMSVELVDIFERTCCFWDF